MTFRHVIICTQKKEPAAFMWSIYADPYHFPVWRSTKSSFFTTTTQKTWLRLPIIMRGPSDRQADIVIVFPPTITVTTALPRRRPSASCSDRPLVPVTRPLLTARIDSLLERLALKYAPKKMPRPITNFNLKSQTIYFTKIRISFYHQIPPHHKF